MRGDPRIPSGETPAPHVSAGARAELQPQSQRALLCRFLQDNVPLLLGIIRSYVVRSGLAHGDAVQAAATEVFHDAVYEALAHAERFDPTIQPQAWFLAIALNVLKRRRADASKRSQREVLLSDLPGAVTASDESEVFDWLVAHTQPGPEEGVAADEQATAMLSLLPAGDQEVLRLALLHDLDTGRLAQALNITPGAARVRLHRALNRLRAAWSERESDS